MSKTITIPSDQGNYVIVTINGVTYIYQAGQTATVPDEVAAAIENAQAEKPHGYRESWSDELLAGLTARVAALEAGGGGGSELPEVTADDNGDVLTVVEGAWAKAEPAGGGALVVNITWDDQDVGTADKTAGEIMEAAQSGLVIFVEQLPGVEYIMTHTLLTAHHEEGLYEFGVAGDMMFSASSSTDYPTVE